MYVLQQSQMQGGSLIINGNYILVQFNRHFKYTIYKYGHSSTQNYEKLMKIVIHIHVGGAECASMLCLLIHRVIDDNRLTPIEIC